MVFFVPDDVVEYLGPAQSLQIKPPPDEALDFLAGNVAARHSGRAVICLTFRTAWASKILTKEYLRMPAEIGLWEWGHTITGESVADGMARIRVGDGSAFAEEDVI
ncbi:hypothetical protein B0H11DRAFT_2268300 [Mycena galericulata]|nr:hypothetical protein B0H11DRAFT_2268300 [Mycena galericulata]